MPEKGWLSRLPRLIGVLLCLEAFLWLVIILRSPTLQETWGGVFLLFGLTTAAAIFGLLQIFTHIIQKGGTIAIVISVIICLGLAYSLFIRDSDAQASVNFIDGLNGEDAMTQLLKVKSGSGSDESTNIEELCIKEVDSDDNPEDKKNADNDYFWDGCETDQQKAHATSGPRAINTSGFKHWIHPNAEEVNPENPLEVRFMNPVYKNDYVALFNVFLATDNLEKYDGGLEYFSFSCAPNDKGKITTCRTKETLQDEIWYQHAIPGVQNRKIYWGVRAELQSGKTDWVIPLEEKRYYFVPLNK